MSIENFLQMSPDEQHAAETFGTRRCISAAEAQPAPRQHTRPCGDCPMSPRSLRGWLGGATPEEYVQLAHGESIVPCHTVSNQQCAGMAIYRANVAKKPRIPQLTLPKDPEAAFDTPMAFLAHHRREA
jgi:hypothetical protein